MRVKPYNFDLVAKLPLIGGRDPGAVRMRVEAMEKLLEGLYVLPIIKRRIGLDVMLDALPIAGDIAGAILGAYLIWEARNLGMSKFSMFRMGSHVAINALLGAIPFLGLIPTFLYRSNTYNLRIIRKHLDKYHPGGAVIAG